MARPARLDEQRRELVPILARAFSDLGYRRTTTAEIAKRCGVRENILYRHWSDKVAMFVAALEYVHDLAVATWQRVLDDAAREADGATDLLDYEARHLGEFGNYRIIFSALGDVDTPEIKRALRRMYVSFHRMIGEALVTARRGKDREPDTDHAAWAVIGLGTMATILGELGLLSHTKRGELIRRAGQTLVSGKPAR